MKAFRPVETKPLHPFNRDELGQHSMHCACSVDCCLRKQLILGPNFRRSARLGSLHLLPPHGPVQPPPHPHSEALTGSEVSKRRFERSATSNKIKSAITYHYQLASGPIREDLHCESATTLQLTVQNTHKRLYYPIVALFLAETLTGVISPLCVRARVC